MTQYNSKLSNGDRAFAIIFTCNNQPTCKELTIGRVTIEDTNSPGRAGEQFFDNYKPQLNYIERYMCIETGIGSGTVYEYGRHIFKTIQECADAILLILAEKVLN